MAASVEAGLDDGGVDRNDLPAIGVGWRRIAEAPGRAGEAERHRGQVLAIAAPAFFAGAGPAETGSAGFLGVAGTFAFDPFLGDRRHRGPSEHVRRFEVEVQGGADDAPALELGRIEIDEEEFLRALEFQLRRIAVIAFLFGAVGRQPQVARCLHAERFGGGERGAEHGGQQADGHARGRHASNQPKGRRLSTPIRGHFAGTKPAGRRSLPGEPVSLSPRAVRMGVARAERRATTSG